MSAQTAAACVCKVRLLDVEGRTRETPLLRSDALLKLTRELKRQDALRVIDEVARLLQAGYSAAKTAAATATASISDARHGEVLTTLYVKDSCVDAESEVRRRQRRFVAKLRGRFFSADQQAVEALLQTLLAAPPSAQDDVAVAEYRGVVEALTTTDTTAAIALAINPSLPSLTSGANAALAALVQLHAPAAVHAFLESFAGKDEMTLASETAATHLALRLRKTFAPSSSSSSSGRDSVRHAKKEVRTDIDEASALTAARLLTEATHFHVDPGVVFPTEPASIQRWADQFLRPSMRPAQKAAVLLQQVQRRRLLPRRVAAEALSVWTLTDLERHWLKLTLPQQPHRNTGDAVEEADEVLHNTAYQLALKDPKRNLIDSRLLHTYAAALARGDVSPLDSSFPAFLEECGECHSEGDAERPAVISFTLPRLPDGVPLLRALHDLAPQCSYWRTLLNEHAHQDRKDATGASNVVRARKAPLDEVQVEVRLPSTHECVAAAKSGTVPLPPLPVLYEDADVLVVNKPAGLATSRHGLSCTQVAAPTTDLISVLLATRFKGNDGAQTVFRQGQVHRLDAETSGCLLIAKTDVAADSLRHQMGTSAAFSHQSKIYHALCFVLEPSLRNVKLHDDVVDAVDPKIRTRYRVIKFFPKHRIAWVECRIQQGKKHQIRRHLASKGLPILADVEHGGAVCCQSMMDRVALHARSVSFIHPVSADPLVVESPLPEDFRRCLAQLR